MIGSDIPLKGEEEDNRVTVCSLFHMKVVVEVAEEGLLTMEHLHLVADIEIGYVTFAPLL